MPNFIRCHLAVIAMLDQAQTLGILDEVSDEGDYGEQRDVSALARAMGQWNASIAQQVAALRSVLGNTVQSPVSGFPDFAQLAANGQPVPAAAGG